MFAEKYIITDVTFQHIHNDDPIVTFEYTDNNSFLDPFTELTPIKTEIIRLEKYTTLDGTVMIGMTNNVKLALSPLTSAILELQHELDQRNSQINQLKCENKRLASSNNNISDKINYLNRIIESLSIEINSFNTMSFFDKVSLLFNHQF